MAQTERVTILMTPARKADLAARAAARHMSIGQYVRIKVEADDEDVSDEQEAQLALLVAEINEAVPPHGGAARSDERDVAGDARVCRSDAQGDGCRLVSTVSDALAALKNVVLMQERLDVMRGELGRTAADLRTLADRVYGIDKRVTRIETMIEMTRSGGGSTPKIEG